ncbi:AAA family ATPase [Fodinibius sediminis]|uniref:Aminoglycoside phosphotransferase domain-containing protein n=1 Tax=Fodinibius sediminis TaxID=1214077 RepID=A0A521C5U7_9BACT|nr:AAA family ATPase [Fodinibius sediminis]SMO54788.1 hypothetical protein SAMN06265218_10570 [Fodinibius sediminis]
MDNREASSSGPDPGLLHFLEQPASYPHAPEEVHHIQTHISHVFIAPPYVYKLKKPVDFGFLDYSSLAKRKKYCYREVELNRRLTDDVYLGVVGIAGKHGDYRIIPLEEEGEAETVAEYAVKMRKLSDQYFLQFHIENGTLTVDKLNRVADKLARFYQEQQDEALARWGSIEQIKVNTDENFQQTRQFISDTIDRPAYDVITYYTNTYFQEHESLFLKRQEQGRIIDGHGDLHLDHIYISPEKVMVYDCIEFNDRFRYGDLAADLAFLAMDLDFNDCWEQERHFVDRMARMLGDDDLIRIINFYKCYRAYVKGKVKSLQSTEHEVPVAERERARRLATRYFNLSLRYALAGSDVLVLIVMGRVGTGKSTLSKHLSEKLGMPRFSSDYIRKRSMDQPLTERTPASRRNKLYSREQSAKTYATLRAKAANAGNSMILDATFSKIEERRRLTRELESEGIDYIFIEVRAADAIIKERLKAREEQPGIISDARLEDFKSLSRGYEPPVELQDNHSVRVDSGQPVEESIRELYTRLAERNLKIN